MTRTARAYRGSVLTPTTNGAVTFLRDGVVRVDPSGRITEVAPYVPAASTPGGERQTIVHDLSGHLLVPGFVDTHLHVPQTRVIGSASGPLLEWLQATVFPEEAKFADDAYARLVTNQFVDSCVRVGTTSFMAFASSHPEATRASFEIMLERGVRATLGLTLMDQNCPDALSVDASRALSAVEKLAADFHGAGSGLVRTAVTPRFALSCTRGMLEGAASVASRLGLPIQTHVSENEREGVETLRVHPFAEDYLGVYESLGLLGPRTLLAHAIHLSPSEWDRIASTGTAIAHCPDSNAFLGSGRFTLSRADARGVRVGLGSDVAAGRTFDMRRISSFAFDTARETHSAISEQRLFELATLRGAEAIGIEAVAGSLEAGKDADIAVLRPQAPCEDLATALRLATSGSELAPCVRTFVRGRMVFDARS